MRKPMIAGNWKMNKTPAETVALVEDLKKIQVRTKAEVVVCPMTVSLFAAATQLKGTDIKLGAQNVHFEDKGAFTGECNIASLKELGVEYVILGHSERRQYFAETDETVNKKVLKVLAEGLKPIVCVGESLQQKQTNITNEVVCMQTKAALCGVSPAKVTDVVIAYEPIWAIGTGMTATATDANRTIAASVSDTCIYTMQDLLNLGNEARINTPATLGGNWTWRMLDGAITRELEHKLTDWTETYFRIPSEAEIELPQ